MNARLSDEERLLVEAATNFGQTDVAPHAAAWERDRRVPVQTLRRAAALGLTGIQVPKPLGGQGAGFLAKLRIAEELSAHCMAFAFSLINTHNAAAKLARDGGPALRDRYLPRLLSGDLIGATALSEPGAGSDFAAIATMARKVDGGWRLDGEKAWITNAAVADLFIVYAQTDKAKRGRGIACFLVDAAAPGFDRRPPFQLLGGHAIGAGGFQLQDYFVADDAVIHPPGEAFKAALGSINGARTYVAAMCCGMLQAALRQALRYGAERQAFGQPLLGHQGIRWLLADVATDLEAARLLTYRAADLIEAGADAVLAASHAKKFAARIAVWRIADCIQAMGAAGLREEYGLGRHLNCAKIAHYVDGSTEIQNERIGALMLAAYGG